MWHQKNPKELKELSVDWPEHVYCCGKAEQILYKSDKWEKDGDFYTYDHVFDTRPDVYCSDKSILSEFIKGRAKKVTSLLGIKSLDTPVAAPALAKTVELTISLSDGTGQTISFSSYPLLCCTLDKKTLIICAKNDVLFIRGGKMHVTERGIVK
jgi:hypothetical protein